MKDINVLFTCIGGPIVPYLLKALKGSKLMNVRIVGTDMSESPVGLPFVDSFAQLPAGNDPAYVESVFDLARKENIDVIIPCSDEEALSLCADQQQFFDEGIIPCVPTADMARIMENKADMYDHVASLGLSLPEYHRVSTVDELQVAAEAMGYPEKDFVIKPTVARGGRGVWVVRKETRSLASMAQALTVDAVELETLLQAARRAPFPEHIVMPNLTGDMFDVDTLALGGETYYQVPRRRFHVRTTPFRGCWIEENRAVLELAGKLQDALKLPYLFDYDIILDQDDKPWLLEVNPRMSASVAVSVLSGVNLVEYLVLLATGQDVPQVEIPWGKGGKPIFDLVETPRR